MIVLASQLSPLLGEVGLGLTMLAAALAVFFGVGGAVDASPRWGRAARWSMLAMFVLFTACVGLLLAAIVRSDFRLDYVVRYTERALPTGFKLAALWAGQEGSLLLWGWLVGLVSAMASFGLRRLGRVDRHVSLAVLGGISGFFAMILLFAANPFATVAGATPPDGRGLNPMLQDPAMIVHPPVLFVGYALYTVPFAILIGALVSGRRDDQWLAATRRWLLGAWCFLSAGIVIGAWWAYVELGWGGYWAWDPVENASLLPWLTSTALLHSIMVQQHRGMFRFWNASLIALSFLLCIFGTYITRSGVIDSVHAFGESVLGTFFLVFMIVCLIACVGLMIWRRKSLRSAHPLDAMISREGAFLLGNVMLTLMMVTTLVGTIFPLLSEIATGNAVNVGAAFYNRIVAPMALVVVALMASGPVLAFGRNAPRRIVSDLTIPGIFGTVAVGLVAMTQTTNAWVLLCVAITVIGTMAVIVAFGRAAGARRRSTGEGLGLAAARLIDRDHRRYGGQLAHLGLMMIVIGVIASSIFSGDTILRLRPGQSAEVAGHTFTLVSLDEVRRSNHGAVRAIVQAERAGRSETLAPERRFYDAWPEPNTEVAIRSSWHSDIYVSLAGWEQRGAIVAIEVRVNPGVLWIWIGGCVMILGGGIAMLPALLPVPRRARAAHAAQSEAVRTARATPGVACASVTEDALA